MEIKLQNITKTYFGDTVSTLENINLDIAKNDFFVILGPEKCGKSTLLRMIAGLNSITSGNLYFGSNCVNKIDLKNRNLAMMFQSSSPYLHLTIYKNQAFLIKFLKNKNLNNNLNKWNSFKILKISTSLKKTQAKNNCKFSKISSTILKKPKLFLIDEPLAKLDAQTHIKLRKEFINIHQQLKTTIIYATENVFDAMAMATKIAIINQSKIEQIGSPLSLYKKPRNIFVAKYLGHETFNLWAGKVVGNLFVSFSSLISCHLPEKYLKYLRYQGLSEISLGIRGEHLKIVSNKTVSNFSAAISTIEFLGKEQQISGVISDNETVVATIFNKSHLVQNNLLKKTPIFKFKFNVKNAFFFNTKTGQAIWP